VAHPLTALNPLAPLPNGASNLLFPSPAHWMPHLMDVCTDAGQSHILEALPAGPPASSSRVHCLGLELVSNTLLPAYVGGVTALVLHIQAGREGGRGGRARGEG
jgi:hypothetical protein